ncbi:MAG: hypothetical protein ACU843_05120 [Gammaproteobacteria bacterium]
MKTGQMNARSVQAIRDDSGSLDFKAQRTPPSGRRSQNQAPKMRETKIYRRDIREGLWQHPGLPQTLPPDSKYPQATKTKFWQCYQYSAIEVGQAPRSLRLTAMWPIEESCSLDIRRG